MNEAEAIQQARWMYRPYGPKALMIACEDIPDCCVMLPEICRTHASEVLWEEGWRWPVRCCLSCKRMLMDWRTRDCCYYDVRTAEGQIETSGRLFQMGKIRLFYPRRHATVETWAGLGDK